MTTQAGPPLGGGEFDRDAATRLSDAALDAAWAEPGARVLRVRGGLVALGAGSGGSGAAALDLAVVRGARGEAHLYLGRVAGRPVFAMVDQEGRDSGYAEPVGGWQHPFEFGSSLAAAERELMTVALALANWHASSGFSPRDGGPTEARWGGWARHDAHGGEHFPRTDAAVIVLVEHEDRLLLGSNVLWESGRFSLLAGFVEAGESAEQTVVREVYEEAGVRVEGVRYVASQPWPFPRSLMLGFRARLAGGADPARLSPDPDEIAELRWFTREELRNPAPGIVLPMSLSIARWLIDLWVAEGDGADRADGSSTGSVAGNADAGDGGGAA